MVARRTTRLSPYCQDRNAPIAGLITKLAANVAETWNTRPTANVSNETFWCIYIALYCVLLYTQSALQSCMRTPHTIYRWRGERVIETIKCMRSPHTSYRWRGERVIETIKCMRSPHTSYRWRRERVIEPIKCMRSPHTSYRWRGERVIETIKCMRSPHTRYRWRGES